MDLLLKGICAGFSIAAPVGAIGCLCIQQTLQYGSRYGRAAGLGAATADMLYGLLVVVGAHAVKDLLQAYRMPLTIFGGLFLIYLGLKKLIAPPATHCDASMSNKGIGYTYGMTFLLTIVNPATIIDFIALFTGLTIRVDRYMEGVIFVVGVFIGSVSWWLLLSSVVALWAQRVSTDVLRYINYAAGLVIIAFGLYALAQVCFVAY